MNMIIYFSIGLAVGLAITIPIILDYRHRAERADLFIMASRDSAAYSMLNISEKEKKKTPEEIKKEEDAALEKEMYEIYQRGEITEAEENRLGDFIIKDDINKVIQ